MCAGGSWGTGTTKEEAERNARKMLYGAKEDKKQRKYAEIEVPAGRKLMVREAGMGITWWTEPEITIVAVKS